LEINLYFSNDIIKICDYHNINNFKINTIQMNKVLILISFVSLLVAISSSDVNSENINYVLDKFMDNSPQELYKVWQQLYKKTLNLESDESKFRFAVFQENLRKIKDHNSGNHSYKIGLNQFSDMTQEEFAEKMGTLKIVKGNELQKAIKRMNISNFEIKENKNLKASYAPIDYSSSFGPARNQLKCGSCWAFATTGAVEGALGLKQGSPFGYLSPQQLVDCNLNNYGCQGGYLTNSFEYIKKSGIQLDSTYPYQAVKKQCSFNSTLVSAVVKDYYYCNNFGIDPKRFCSTSMTYSLLQYGPAAVTIDASAPNFQSYQSGIFTSKCSQPNHAVILVGFGTDATNGDFWIIRNSWGASWGEAGYIRVKINPSNRNSCFIEEQTWVPIV